MPRLNRVLLLAPALFATGCVEQVMTIQTDPPGAVVYLNDQILGRTPLDKDFQWYGNYDVVIRKEGYEAVKTHKWVRAPWWNWVPFDLMATMVPWQVRDHQVLKFTMKPIAEASNVPGPLMERAIQMQGELQMSEFTRKPSSRPTAATKPVKGRKAGTQPVSPAP